MKKRLLVLELWGLGDLAIAVPFLQAASEQFAVTLIAPPVAGALKDRFFPTVELRPFVAPWTAFRGKYRFLHWPWKEFASLIRECRSAGFEAAVSGRWDLREHLLLALLGSKKTLGFPNRGSGALLTHPLTRVSPLAHRYEDWKVAATVLGVNLPPLANLRLPPRGNRTIALVHTGAARALRVWPLDRYAQIIQFLRSRGIPVMVVCDRDQREWWITHGERDVRAPSSIGELLSVIDESALFIGNDSGPGHLAALCGVPTFTFFGPQFSEWFHPIHPLARWIDGKACPYKQCFDYCRYPTPHCLHGITGDEAIAKITQFVQSVRN